MLLTMLSNFLQKPIKYVTLEDSILHPGGRESFTPTNWPGKITLNYLGNVLKLNV